MKRKLMFIVVLVSLFLTGSIFAADYEVQFLVNWAAEKMGVEVKTDVVPRIVWCQKEELYKKLAEELTLEFGDDSPYFRGFVLKDIEVEETYGPGYYSRVVKPIYVPKRFTTVEIVEIMRVEAYYSPVEKTIYILEGAPDDDVLHEVVHFIQDVYLKKIPQLPTGETKKFLVENASNIIQLTQQLEEEAERITEAFQKFKETEQLVKH